MGMATEASRADAIQIDNTLAVVDGLEALGATEPAHLRVLARHLLQTASRMEHTAARTRQATAQLTGIPYISPPAA